MTELLISQYLDWLQTCRRSPRTIDARRNILDRMDEGLPQGLVTATAEELQAWLYRDQWGAHTLSTYYGCAAAFFVWATSEACPDPLDFNPMAVVPRPPVPRGLPRPVSDEELRKILAMSTDPFQLWAILAAYQGLRCIEIARLHREHVTEDELRVVAGKGGKPGELPTHPEVWKRMRDLPDGPVAWTRRGVQANAHYVSMCSGIYFRTALELPGVTLHRLRHWYGTMIYRKTKDLRRTQEMLRHSSPDTTAIYTQVADEERRAAIHALPTFTDA